MKRLIVNADDFGMSPGINEGIISGHIRGIITSASLMVRWPSAAAAAEQSAAHPQLSVGLHVELGEWVYRDENWQKSYEVVDPRDPRAVAGEVERQLEAFHALVGCDPTHLDSHQHMHHDEPLRTELRRLATRLQVPLRQSHNAVQYCGEFYGQSSKGYSCPEMVRPEALIAVLQRLPDGITELACHPAAAADMDSTYREERVSELDSLCDPSVRAAVEAAGIVLCSFRDVPAEPC